MEERQENNKGRLRIFTKRDAPLYIAIIVCLAVCAWTISSVGAYKEQCNQHWIEYFEEADCRGFVQGVTEPPTNFTEPFGGLKWNTE